MLSLSFSIARNCALIASRMQLQNISSIWKAKDHRSSVVTCNPNLILYFLAQISIYMRCSGASSIYASFKAVRECICGKIYVFGSRFIKKGLIILHREMEKRPSVQDSNGEANITITICHSVTNKHSM
jgi:hypothetical protein